MPFAVGDYVVYNPNLSNLAPAAERLRHQGRILHVDENYALVYFPAAAYIARILFMGISELPYDITLPLEITPFSQVFHEYSLRFPVPANMPIPEYESEDDYIIVTDSASEAD